MDEAARVDLLGLSWITTGACGMIVPAGGEIARFTVIQEA